MEKTENPSLHEGDGRLYPEREVRLSPISTGADYILPDYMGDIRKILDYSAKVLPSGRFLGDGEASFVGIVCYSVVYLDSENKLTEASFTSDYEYEIKTDEAFVDGDGKAEILSVAIRPSSPRKLSAKAMLSAAALICEDRNPPSAEALKGAEMLPATIKESSMTIVRLAEREYAEEGARLQGVIADEAEVILSGGKGIVTGSYYRGGELHIEGYLDMFALLMIEGETPLRVEKRVPISEVMLYDCESEC